MSSDDVRCCTTRQHKTHITESRVILYRWHPWYQRTVQIVRGHSRGGEAVFCCTLELAVESGTRYVPQWMFDAVTCCDMRLVSMPTVNIEALFELKHLLNDIVPGRCEGVLQGEHHSLPYTGGADATLKPPKDPTTSSVPSLLEDTSVDRVAAGGEAGDGAIISRVSPRRKRKLFRDGLPNGGDR